MSRCFSTPLSRAALLLALFAVLSLSRHVEAGSGTVVDSGPEEGRIDLTFKFTYPPSAGDIAALETAIEEANVRICDATEGQMRLGNVTITGGSSVNDDLADVLLLPDYAQSNADLCWMGFEVPCSALSQPGSNVRLYRDDFNGLILAHELGHLVFDLGDEYDNQTYHGASGGIGRCIECANTSGQHTCLMQQANCGGADDASELCRTSNHDPVGGDPMFPACTPANQLACAPPSPALCPYFNPSTCRFELTDQSGWSFEKFGEIHSCWSHLALTFPFLTEQVANPVTAAPRGCADLLDIQVDVEPADQIMLVLDRSWSMNFLPNEGQCSGPGCTEICGNNYDDDQDGLKDTDDSCVDKQTRLDFLKEAARAFVNLNQSTGPFARPDIGVTSFQCVASPDEPLQEATTFNANNNLIPAIQGLKPNGNTAIGDALAFAADQFPDTGLNRSVLLITDGQQNCGANDPATVAAQLEREGIRVYTITFGEASGSGSLPGVAGRTRGKHVNAGDDRDLVSAFVQQWAHHRNAGLLIPKLRYRFRSNSTVAEPKSLARGSLSWKHGQHGPVGDSPVNSPTYNNNAFEFQVEPGTERFVVSLAGDMESMTGFGVRALLKGPAGPNPSSYDTSGLASAQPRFEMRNGSFYRLLIVSDPNPGLWRLEVRSTGAAGHAVVQTGKVTVVAESASTDLYTGLDRRVVDAPGQKVHLTVRPRYKTPLRGATLEATVRRPDGTYHPLPLTGGEDFRTNFLGQINAFPLQGPYEVRVYLRTGAGTQNDPGEAHNGGASTAVPVPLLERTATEHFYVATGQPPCGGQVTANCYQPAPQ